MLHSPANRFDDLLLDLGREALAYEGDLPLAVDENVERDGRQPVKRFERGVAHQRREGNFFPFG